MPLDLAMLVAVIGMVWLVPKMARLQRGQDRKGSVIMATFTFFVVAIYGIGASGEAWLIHWKAW